MYPQSSFGLYPSSICGQHLRGTESFSADRALTVSAECSDQIPGSGASFCCAIDQPLEWLQKAGAQRRASGSFEPWNLGPQYDHLRSDSKSTKLLGKIELR